MSNILIVFSQPSEYEIGEEAFWIKMERMLLNHNDTLPLYIAKINRSQSRIMYFNQNFSRYFTKYRYTCILVAEDQLEVA
ncbi:hypothetical protein EJB05_40541, partial [Eragrostis curvula]